MDALTTATRLRRARLAAGLQLSDIEQRTRISPSILRWIDDGQFHRLPAGIYARSYVRAFAQAVGLDPIEIVASVEHALPAAVELVAPSKNKAPSPSRQLSAEWLRVAAASVDAAVLTIVYGLVLGATAGVCRQPLSEILAFGMPAVIVVLLLLTALYFLVFAGVQGQTPGARALGLPPFHIPGPMHLRTIVERAIRVFVCEASFGVEIASRRSASREVSAAEPYGSSSTP